VRGSTVLSATLLSRENNAQARAALFFRCKFTLNQPTPFESARFNPIDFLYYKHCPGAIAASIHNSWAGKERQHAWVTDSTDSGE
jgi:hypothetical protein